jgi:hypothetical protein
MSFQEVCVVITIRLTSAQVFGKRLKIPESRSPPIRSCGLDASNEDP